MRKNILIVISFLFITTFKMHGDEIMPHYYLQYNVMTNIGSTFNFDLITEATSATESAKRNKVKTRSNLFDTFYNLNFIAGYKFNKYWAAEFEVAGYDFMQKRIDGNLASIGDINFAVVRANYNTFNVKYTIANINNFYPFVKAGMGVGFFDAPIRNTQGYGNRITPVIQGAFGVYYNINRYLDVETSYKYLLNMPKMTYVSSTSVIQAYKYKESSLYFSLRLKLPM